MLAALILSHIPSMKFLIHRQKSPYNSLCSLLVAVACSVISFPIYGCFTLMPFIEDIEGDPDSNTSAVPDLAAKYVDPR